MSNTVIALKSSGTASNVVNANNLVYGELAINYADGILYYKTASNTVGSIKTAQPGGLNTEIQFNDSGVFGGSSNFVYQKSNVRLGIGTSSPLGKLHIKSNAAAGAGGFSHLVVDQTLDSSQSRISLKSRFGSLSVTETEVAAIHLGTVTAGYVSGILSSDIRFDTINTGTLSERVRIKSDGNVGIGTTNPSYPLEIASPNSTSIAFQRTGVSAKKWGFDSDNDSLYIVNITDYNSQRLTVTNDGKIGIGTIYPSTQLYVKTEGTSNTSVKTALTLENYPYAFDPASNGFGVGIEFRGKNPQGGSSIYGNIEGVYETRSGTHQGGALLFKTDGYIGDSTTRMIIDSVGNLGLGTTSPTSILHIVKGNGVVTLDNGDGNYSIWQQTGSDTRFGTQSNIPLAFYVNQNEYVRITSAGNVGIGTTSPGYNLDVNGSLGVGHGLSSGVILTIGPNSTNDKYLRIRNPNGNFEIGSSGNQHYLYGVGSSNYLSFYTNSIQRALISSGGDFVIGNSSAWSKFMVSMGTSGVDNGSGNATRINDFSNATVILHNQDSVGTGTKFGLFFAMAGAPGVASGIAGYKENGTWNTGLQFYTNNITGGSYTDVIQEKMRLTAAGNLGIGTTSPSQKLHVVGNAWINRPNNKVDNNGATEFGSRVEFNNDFASGQSAYVVFKWATYNNFLINVDYDGNVGGSFANIQFGKINDVYMHITGASGNVGIGTTSPGSKLDVKGTLRLSGSNTGYVGITTSADAGSTTYTLPSTDGTNGHVLSTNGSGTLSWVSAAGASSYWVQTGNDIYYTTGNVGIGTTSPGAILHVNASGGGTIRASRSSVSGEYIQMDHDGTNGSLRVSGAYSLIFHTNSIERARITSDGNVGIGTASPFGTTSNRTCFSVNGTNDVSLNVGSGGVQRAYLYGSASVGQVGTIGGLPLVFAPNDTERARINSSGHLTVGTTNSTMFSGLFPALLGLQASGNVDSIIARTDPTAANAAAAVLHQASASPGFDAVRISTVSTSNSAAALNILSGVNDSTGLGGSSIFFVRQDGNVGIGKTDPSFKLDVDTSMRISAVDGSGGLQIGTATPSVYHYINFGGAVGGTDDAWQIGRSPTGGVGPTNGFYIYDLKSSATRFVINTSGNVGIGTTSPGSKLTVQGGAGIIRAEYVNNTSQYTTLNYDGVQVVGSQDAYWIVASGQAHLWYVGPTERMRITSAGNVGIGTTNPGAKLHVLGDIRFGNNATYYGSINHDAAITGANIYNSQDTGGHIFQREGTTQITIDSSGRLLVGTTSNFGGAGQFAINQGGGNIPSIHLIGTNDVGGGGREVSAIFSGIINDTGPAYGNLAKISAGKENATQGNSAGYMVLSTTPNGGTLTEAVRITSIGNVGIGTSSPSNSKLHIVGDWVGGHSTVKVQGITDATTGYGFYNTDGSRLGYLAYTSAGFEWYNNINVPIIFHTNTAERMRITGAGNVGIGTSSPGQKLSIVEAANYDPPATTGTNGGHFAVLKNDGPAAGSYGFLMGVSNNGNVWQQVQRVDGTQSVYNLLLQPSGGNVGIGTTSPSEKLQVNGNIKIPTGGILYVENPAGGRLGYLTTNSTGTLLSAHNDSGEPLLLSAPASTAYMSFSTAGSERARITSNGNLGIGTTTPQYRLDVNSGLNSNSFSASFGSTHGIGVWSGIHFGYLETGNSAYRKSALIFERQDGAARGKIHILNNGTNDATSATLADSRFTILYDGKVGIGTTSPSETLHVSGTIRVDGTTNGIRIFQNGSNSTNSHLYLANAANDRAYNWQLNSTGSGLDFWAYDGSAWMRHHTFLANGDVGIGNTSPAVKLHINGNVRTNGIVDVNPVGGAFRFYDGTTFYGGLGMGGWAGIGASTDIVMYLQGVNYYITNQSTTLVKVQTDGNVGIGTASPSVRLHVYKASDAAFRVQSGGGSSSYIQLDDGVSYGYLIKNLSSSTGNGALAGALYTHTDNNKAFQHIHAGTPLFTILSTGNVGIGTTSPSSRLHLYNTSGDVELRMTADSSYDPIFRMTGESNGTGEGFTISYDNNVGDVYFNSIYGASTYAFHFQKGAWGSGTSLMVMQNDGKIGIGTASPGKKLTISRASETTSDQLELRNEGGISTGNYDGIAWTQGASGGTTLASIRVAYNSSGTPDMVFNLRNDNNVIFLKNGGNVGVGTNNPGYKLEVNGSFAATTKSFVIDHPTKEGMKLRYGSLEGPENGVYIRGRLKNNNTIELPEYWTKLVDPDTITVQLTPIGKNQELYVEDILNNKVIIAGSENINCFYMILAERIDVEKLTVEYKEEN